MKGPRAPRGTRRPPVLAFGDVFQTLAPGINGPGLIDALGAPKGYIVQSAVSVPDGSHPQVSLRPGVQCEATISVAGKLRQLGSTDHSGRLFVLLLTRP